MDNGTVLVGKTKLIELNNGLIGVTNVEVSPSSMKGLPISSG